MGETLHQIVQTHANAVWTGLTYKTTLQVSRAIYIYHEIVQQVQRRK